MADIKLSIDDLPPATTVYSADVFVIDQLGGDGYTKKLTYNNLKATLSNTFVLKAGDTMTGALILNTSSPVSALQAASKGYVDAQVSAKVSKAGDTMTGPLTLNSNAPTAALHAASRGYVQNNFLPISGIGTGEQGTGMTGFLTLCAHPTSAFHAATKLYVDTVVSLSSQSLQTIINNLSGVNSKTLAKAWATFDGSLASPSVAGRNYNISLITKNGTGDFTIVFASNMVDANYAVAISDNHIAVAAAHSCVFTQTVSSFTIKFQDTGVAGNVYNPTLASVIVFGN